MGNRTVLLGRSRSRRKLGLCWNKLVFGRKMSPKKIPHECEQASEQKGPAPQVRGVSAAHLSQGRCPGRQEHTDRGADIGNAAGDAAPVLLCGLDQVSDRADKFPTNRKP